MAEVSLPNFKIDKNDPFDGIKELVKQIKPSWNTQKLIIKEITGGYSGKMFSCCDENNEDDAIAVRIRNLVDNFTEAHGPVSWTNEFEIKVVAHLSKLGHFSKFYATFANGYCYHFIKGHPMINGKEKTGYVDDKMLSQIAKEMLFLHTVKIPGVDYTGNGVLDMIIMMLSSDIPITENEKFPSKSTILKEIQFVINFVGKFDSPHAICHGDPHPGNFVWNPDTETVTFVDWEGTVIGHQFHDVANFLMSSKMMAGGIMTGMENIKYPSDYEDKFLRTYFEEWCKQKDEHVTDEGLQDFKDKIEKFKLSPLICTGLFSMIIPDVFEEVSGNAEEFTVKAWEMYLDIKKKVYGKREFEVKEK